MRADLSPPVRQSTRRAATHWRAGQQRRRLNESRDVKPGFLRRSVVTPLTQRRYAEAARRLRLFGGAALDQLSMKALDKLVVQYMEFLFRAGEAVSEARYLLFGVIFELDLTAESAEVLPLAKRTLKGFARRAPESSRDPPPLDLL